MTEWTDQITMMMRAARRKYVMSADLAVKIANLPKGIQRRHSWQSDAVDRQRYGRSVGGDRQHRLPLISGFRRPDRRPIAHRAHEGRLSDQSVGARH